MRRPLYTSKWRYQPNFDRVRQQPLARAIALLCYIFVPPTDPLSRALENGNDYYQEHNNNEMGYKEMDEFDINEGRIGTYWQTTSSTAKLGENGYYGRFDILAHKTREEAEAARLRTLGELRADFEKLEAKQGSAEWHELKNKIASYSNPVRLVELPPCQDNGRGKTRKFFDFCSANGQLINRSVEGDKSPNVET
ncbi:hypothetical protein Daus18300_004186 [Diaporthe australafricana]|uniref:Uncharacterized protein n=1 Tax=Diaporthe australafricana TaxID=127596 RepID=A0ABR3XBP1_9PEZI